VNLPYLSLLRLAFALEVNNCIHLACLAHMYAFCSRGAFLYSLIPESQVDLTC